MDNRGNAMGYRIQATEMRVEFEIDARGERQERLLDAFRECRTGRCGCPSDEYKKLGTFSIGITGRHIVVGMSPRPGARFDTGEIRHCLHHLLSKVEYRSMAASGT